MVVVTTVACGVAVGPAGAGAAALAPDNVIMPAASAAAEMAIRGRARRNMTGSVLRQTGYEAGD